MPSSRLVGIKEDKVGITQAGLGEMANLGTNDSSPNYWAYLAVGTGTTAFDNERTFLITPSGARVAATVTRIKTIHSDDTMRFTATFAISSTISGAVAPGTITEVGIFNALTGGEMLARTVLTTSHTVTDGQVYALIYDIPIAAA